MDRAIDRAIDRDRARVRAIVGTRPSIVGRSLTGPKYTWPDQNYSERTNFNVKIGPVDHFSQRTIFYMTDPVLSVGQPFKYSSHLIALTNQTCKM